MAERRMFAKTIIDSDAFLDMPLTTQALYFHLSMRGDDEGFINNPKKIQRMIGATEDDLKLLVAKNFIIPFESGVVVIKHWKIHNYIRGDRLTETNYKEEREMLIVKDNGAYTLNQELNVIESLPATDKRKIAYEKSCLPYSFTYKMRRAFEGHTCPVCGCKMSSSSRLTIPTIQHNHPISKGGAHELENISVICGSCNASIQDTETGELNNKEAIETWDKIVAAEKQGVQWFNEPKLLDSIDVSQMSVKCQSNFGQMSAQVRLGKDSKGKDSQVKESKGESKHAHGEYAHVLLKDSELEKLKADYGEELTQQAITYLDEYIEMKGAKYKSHYLAIRKWVIDAVKEHQPKKSKAAAELDDFYNMAAEWAKEG